MPTLIASETLKPESVYSQYRDELYGVSSFERPHLFADFAHELKDDSDFWRLLALAHTTSDCPDAALRRYWICRRKGRKVLFKDEVAEMFNAIPDEVTIYRGAAAGNDNGICWTLSQETARFFAFKVRYVSGRRALYRGTVAKKHILYCSNARDEQEIIVNPAKVEDVKWIE